VPEASASDCVRDISSVVEGKVGADFEVALVIGSSAWPSDEGKTIADRSAITTTISTTMKLDDWYGESQAYAPVQKKAS